MLFSNWLQLTSKSSKNEKKYGTDFFCAPKVGAVILSNVIIIALLQIKSKNQSKCENDLTNYTKNKHAR